MTEKAEEDQVGRQIMRWVNTFPERPEDLNGGEIAYNYMGYDAPAMGLAPIKSAYIVERYISGAYEAEYPFRLIYRVHPGEDTNQRLTADELLNRFGEWARSQRPELGPGMTVMEIEPRSRSDLYKNYQDGDEDHAIEMALRYKVKP